MDDPSARQATAFLNGYVSDFFASTIMSWDELSNTFWRKYWTGF